MFLFIEVLCFLPGSAFSQVRLLYSLQSEPGVHYTSGGLKLAVEVVAHLLKVVAVERCRRSVVVEAQPVSTAARTSSNQQVAEEEPRSHFDHNLAGSHHNRSPVEAVEELAAMAQHLHLVEHRQHIRRCSAVVPMEQVLHHLDRNHHVPVGLEPKGLHLLLHQALVDPKDFSGHHFHSLDRSHLEHFRGNQLDPHRWKGCLKVLA